MKRLAAAVCLHSPLFIYIFCAGGRVSKRRSSLLSNSWSRGTPFLQIRLRYWQWVSTFVGSQGTPVKATKWSQKVPSSFWSFLNWSYKEARASLWSLSSVPLFPWTFLAWACFEVPNVADTTANSGTKNVQPKVTSKAVMDSMTKTANFRSSITTQILFMVFMQKAPAFLSTLINLMYHKKALCGQFLCNQS